VSWHFACSCLWACFYLNTAILFHAILLLKWVSASVCDNSFSTQLALIVDVNLQSLERAYGCKLCIGPCTTRGEVWKWSEDRSS
jgi:hypothetical protein